MDVLIDAWNFLTWGRSQPKMPPAYSRSIKEAIDRYYWYTVHGRGARRMLGRELTEKELKDLIRRIEKEDGYPLSIEVDLGDFDTPHIFFPERYPLRDNLIGFWDFSQRRRFLILFMDGAPAPRRKKALLGDSSWRSALRPPHGMNFGSQVMQGQTAADSTHRPGNSLLFSGFFIIAIFILLYTLI